MSPPWAGSNAAMQNAAVIAEHNELHWTRRVSSSKLGALCYDIGAAALA